MTTSGEVSLRLAPIPASSYSGWLPSKITSNCVNRFYRSPVAVTYRKPKRSKESCY
jgi:hypothetical protein